MRTAVLVLALASGAFAAPKPFSPEDLWLWREARDTRITPDGQWVVYVEEWHDRERDATWSNLRIVSTDGKQRRQWTDGKSRDTSPRWSPDGTRLAWISTSDGSTRILVAAGGAGDSPAQRRGVAEPRPKGAVSSVVTIALPDPPPSSIAWSPDGRSLAFISHVTLDQTAPVWAPPAILPYLRRPAEREAQIFVVPASGGPPRRIASAGRGWCGEPAWSTDGQFLHIPRDGAVLAFRIADGTSRPLVSGIGRYHAVVPSPDGQRIAYLFAESKPQNYTLRRIFVTDPSGRRTRMLAGTLDRDPEHLQWSSDSRTVYFTAEDRGVTRVYAARNDGGLRPVALPAARLNGFSLADNGRAVSVQSPSEVVTFTVDVASRPIVLAAPNESLLAEREIAATEEIVYESEGRPIQAWVVKPSQPTEKHPLLIDIQDDPRRMCGVEFRLRAQILAARGFVALCANPRGTPGYGEHFGNLLSTRHPGDDFDDLMRGVDFVIAKGYVDAQRLHITGGLVAAWAIGHTNRFLSAVLRRPIADWTTHVATHPEGPRRATQWMRAMPWEDPDQYAKRSPLTFAQNFKTPTLILAGDPDPESNELYFALHQRKVDAALVRLPATGRPSEQVLEMETVLAWLER